MRGMFMFAAWHRLLAGVCLLGLAMAPATANAQRTQTEFQLEHFEPLPNQGKNILSVAESRLLPHLGLSMGLFFHYASNPLVRADGTSSGSTVTGNLVEGALRGEIWASLGLFDFLELGVIMPLTLHQFGGDLAAVGRPGAEVDGFAAGDLRIVPKVRFLDPEDFAGFGLSLLSQIYIPTGDTETFNSDGAVRAEVRAVIDYHFDVGVDLALNVGYEFRPKTEPQNLTVDSGLQWGFGIRTPFFLDELKLLASVFGTIPTSDNVARLGSQAVLDSIFTTPIELLAGVEIHPTPQWQVTVGGGAGVTRGIGAPQWRAFASVGFTNASIDTDGDGIDDPDDKCPTIPEDKDGFEDLDGCPDTDNDKDGILDSDDECPNDPEDRDSWEDEDGCPDRDNDKDKFLDEADTCPNEPEDYDNFEDTDGCPDPDNDGDGLPDATDKCPDDPEDRDGFQDDDGCPDPDNDGDTIPDVKDRCPLLPEDFDGDRDEDGCPETKDFEWTDSGLTLRNIHFATGSSKIRQNSYRIIKQLVTELQKHKNLTKLMIEGHTDHRGKDTYNDRLSQGRANAVKQALVDGSVDGGRLAWRGYGEHCPVAPNSTKEGMAKNRRVEIKILEVDGRPFKGYKPPTCSQ